MKTSIILISSLIISLASCTNSGEGVKPLANKPIITEIDKLPKEPISDAEEAALMLMREEEKLARDVYDFLYEDWSAQVFDNISDSEQRHMDAVLGLLNKYQINDPANEAAGIFENQTLLALYKDFTKIGSTSKIDAFKVGAAIEEIDIIDLERELASNIDNEDITLVFEQLTKGSKNHLRAFVRNLTLLGVQYSPQYLSQEAFDKIINQAN